MALLEEAFKYVSYYTHQNKTLFEKDSNDHSSLHHVGSAHGPEFSSGLYVYGTYTLNRDQNTKQLYIQNATGKEYLNEDGTVVGREDVKYKLHFS